MEIINRFQDFLNKAVLIDQTQLVSKILKENKHFDHYNDIFNNDEYRVTLSNGELIGTATLICDAQQELEYEIASIGRQLLLPQNEETIKSLTEKKTLLERDIIALEDAQSQRRHILQWLFVPFWLSDELIQYGEVVFRYMGCNFWGVSYYIGRPIQKETVLAEIFEAIGY